MATRIMKSKLMTAPSYMLIFNFSFLFSIVPIQKPGNLCSNASRTNSIPNLNMKNGTLQCKKFWTIWPKLQFWILFWKYYLDPQSKIVMIFKVTFNYAGKISKRIKFKLLQSILGINFCQLLHSENIQYTSLKYFNSSFVYFVCFFYTP